MQIYTTAKVSPSGQVNASDIKRVLTNALIFLSPAVLIYLLQVNATLINPANSFQWADLLPTQITIGAVMSWFISTLLDFFRKLRDGKK